MPIISYKADEYRALTDPIKNEGGWALEDNPDHNYYDTRTVNGHTQKILFICMHITAGIDDFDGDDTSAEATTRYGMTTTNNASWHVCIDSDSIIPCLRDERTGWVQGVSGYNFNRPGLGVEIGAKSTDWRAKPDWWVEATLRNVAVWCAPRVIEYDLPIRLVRDREEVQRLVNANQPVGFTQHADLVANYAVRTDPGFIKVRDGSYEDTFPWERFFVILSEEVNARKGVSPEQQLVRIAGDDRYETAARASRLAFPGGADSVYLVSSNSPDGMAAAGFNDGPILLVNPNSNGLHGSVLAEISRLKPQRVVAIGGENAVKDVQLLLALKTAGVV